MQNTEQLSEAIKSLTDAIDRNTAAVVKRLDALQAASEVAAPGTPRKPVPEIVLDAVRELGGRASYREVQAHTGRGYSSVYNGLERLTALGKLRKLGKRGGYSWEVV